MKTMHIADFKAQFSEVTEWVNEGEIIKVVKGQNKDLVGFFSKKLDVQKVNGKRSLGNWAHLGKIVFKNSTNTSEEEFFGDE